MLPLGWQGLAAPLVPSPLARRGRALHSASGSAGLRRGPSLRGSPAVPPIAAEEEQLDLEREPGAGPGATVSAAVLLNLARRFPDCADDELLAALRAAGGHGGDAAQALRDRHDPVRQLTQLERIRSEDEQHEGPEEGEELEGGEPPAGVEGGSPRVWIRYADEEGDVYYAHEQTGAVQWEPPPPHAVRPMSEQEQRAHSRALASRASSLPRSDSGGRSPLPDSSISAIAASDDQHSALGFAPSTVLVEVDRLYRYRCLESAPVRSEPADGDDLGETVGTLAQGTVFSAAEMKMTESGRLLVRFAGGGGCAPGWVSLTAEGGGAPLLEAV